MTNPDAIKPLPEMKKPKVLIFVGYYLPGYRAGGPIQTIANLVTHLGDEIDFYIITRDRDSGDSKPYPDIKVDQWNQVGKAQVFYTHPNAQHIGLLFKLWREVRPDIAYLNSFFSRESSLFPLLLHRLRAIPSSKIVIAPRGEFSPGALTLKHRRKRALLELVTRLKTHHQITWQASSDKEASQIRRLFGPTAHIHVARNLAGRSRGENLSTRTKRKGELKVIFLSRISPMKNLDGALKILQNSKGDISFNIVGPSGDVEYWERCQPLIKQLPKNIDVTYHGDIPHHQVAQYFGEHHLLLLPTRGENFGHVIIESLMAGCPALISDQTPWKDLKDQEVGWTLPLDDLDAYRRIIHKMVDMADQEFQDLSARARAYGQAAAVNKEILEQNRRLFQISDPAYSA